MLQPMGLQRVRHDLVTEQQQQYCNKFNKDFLNDPHQKILKKTTTTTTTNSLANRFKSARTTLRETAWREIVKGTGLHLAGMDVGDTPGSSNLFSVLECKLGLFIYTVYIFIYTEIYLYFNRLFLQIV